MRHQIEVAAVEGLPLQPLMFQVQKDTVSFFWEAENPWTSVREVGDQTEWCLSEAFASCFEIALSDALGRFAVESFASR
jgi:hypothetical protein